LQSEESLLSINLKRVDVSDERDLNRDFNAGKNASKEVCEL